MARFAVSAVVGVAVGFFSGNPALGAQAFAATYGVTGFLDPNLKAEGPRLDDLKGPQASYGTPIAYVEGAPRLAGSIIYASVKREIATTTEVDGKGGPSTDQTTYTYEIDVMYLLTVNVMAGVRRIWSNGELIWSVADDADGETLLASDNTDAWRGITIYTGASDQLPDPIMEADLGVGNVPAYRGRCTVMIEGLNLGGNGQLPVLTFEVVSQGDDAFPINSSWSVTVDSPLTTSGTPGSIPYAETNENLYFLNYSGGTPQGAIDEDDPSELITAVAVVMDFSAYASVGNQGQIHYGAADVPALIAVGTAGLGGSYDIGYINGTETTFFNPVQQGVNRRRYVIRGNRTYFVNALTGDQKVFRFATSGGSPIAESATLAGYARGMAANSSTVYVEIANTVYPLDSLTLASAGSSFALPETYITGPSIFCDSAGDLYFLHDTTLYRRSGAAWVVEVSFIGTIPSFNNIIHAPVYRGGRLYFTATEIIGSETITTAYVGGQTLGANTVGLDDVVSRLCLRTGLLTADDIDVTALASDEVRAMAVSRVTNTRSVLETLQTAYLFDAVEGEKLTFVKRGGASAVTIPFEDLGASTGEPVEPFPIRRLNDIELPSQITVKYANVLNDFQDGSESGDRLVTESTRVDVIELALGLTPQEAKRVADVQTMDVAVGILSVGPIALTREHAALEPTDVVTVVNEDGSSYRCRLLKKTEADGLLTFEATLDDATIINSAALTDEDYTPSTLVRNYSLTDAVYLDTPIGRDADNDAGFYVAANGGAKWAGSVINESNDGVTFESAATVTERAVFGTCLTTLGDWTGPRVFDLVNTVRVNVGDGELSSSTRTAILNDQTVNAFAIGVDGRWELGQFRDATLISPGVYDLSYLLRGSRGTEHYMTDHEADETFVLLRLSGIRRVEMETSQLGMGRFYKAVSVYKSLASAETEAFTNNGVGLKPFSPFDVRASRSSNDITLTWQRRTRLATRTVGPLGISIPLGEATEAYAVDVYSDDTYTTVVRTLTSTSAAVTYTSAQQITDGLTPGATVYVDVYQISAVVGRGTPARAAA